MTLLDALTAADAGRLADEWSSRRDSLGGTEWGRVEHEATQVALARPDGEEIETAIINVTSVLQDVADRCAREQLAAAFGPDLEVIDPAQGGAESGPLPGGAAWDAAVDAAWEAEDSVAANVDEAAANAMMAAGADRFGFTLDDARVWANTFVTPWVLASAAATDAAIAIFATGLLEAEGLQLLSGAWLATLDSKPENLA
jgi:hypothetical protein